MLPTTSIELSGVRSRMRACVRVYVCVCVWVCARVYVGCCPAAGQALHTTRLLIHPNLLPGRPPALC